MKGEKVVMALEGRYRFLETQAAFLGVYGGSKLRTFIDMADI